MTFLLCENVDSWLEHSIYTWNKPLQTEILCFWAVMASHLHGGFLYGPVNSSRICCDTVLLKINNYTNIMLSCNTDSNWKTSPLSWYVALISKDSSIFSAIFTILIYPKIVCILYCFQDHPQTTSMSHWPGIELHWLLYLWEINCGSYWLYYYLPIFQNIIH